MGVGKNFGEYIKKNKITVSELSEKTGINQQTIYSLVNRDSSRVDINTFIKLCNAIGVYPEYFSDENPDERLQLNEDESLLIEHYRTMTDHEKAMVKRLVGYGEALKELEDK